jgi:hypothetical protein
MFINDVSHCIQSLFHSLLEKQIINQMRNINRIYSIIFTVFISLAGSALIAQNYKAPAIDATGKITDHTGKHIGWVTTDGIIKDSAGGQIAHVDKDGNLIDHKTNKTLGKAEKNGTFAYHFKDGKESKLTTSAPMNGTCEVKDAQGKTVLLVHENYKQYGACAYHCLTMKKEHKEMKMK